MNWHDLARLDEFILHHYVFFPILSVCIFLFFVPFRRWNTRVAWFISLSAPGALYLPLIIVQFLMSPHPLSVLGFVVFSLYAFPAIWVFPIVLGVQVKNSLGGRWELMNRHSYAWAGVLLVLYFWTAFVGTGLEQM